jgi:hypothetical protein
MSVLVKLGDALLMFWQSLEQRERMLLLLAGSVAVELAVAVASQRDERRREDRIVNRVKEEVSRG